MVVISMSLRAYNPSCDLYVSANSAASTESSKCAKHNRLCIRKATVWVHYLSKIIIKCFIKSGVVVILQPILSVHVIIVLVITLLLVLINVCIFVILIAATILSLAAVYSQWLLCMLASNGSCVRWWWAECCSSSSNV